MKVGCKIGCLKLDADRNNCCMNCELLNDCDIVCSTVEKLIGENTILKFCKLSYKVQE